MSKTKWVASSYGLKIPGSVLDEDKEREVDPGEAVEVPFGYGTHLIEDGLAYEAEEPDTEPVSDGDGDDAYSSMSMEELEAVAKEFGYNPPGNIKPETLRKKVRKLVADKFTELEGRAKELGVDVQGDWALEELEAAIEQASK